MISLRASALACLLVSAMMMSATPSSAREIRKGYYNVSPAMMHAIDVIVAEKMRMAHRR